MPHLEITEVVLVPCNIVNNNYQQNLRIFYTFLCDKSFSQLLYISPKDFIFLKNFDSEFSFIELWFTYQNSKLLEIVDKINITLVIKYNKSMKYKKDTLFSSTKISNNCKIMDFCLLLKMWVEILIK